MIAPIRSICDRFPRPRLGEDGVFCVVTALRFWLLRAASRLSACLLRSGAVDLPLPEKTRERNEENGEPCAKSGALSTETSPFFPPHSAAAPRGGRAIQKIAPLSPPPHAFLRTFAATNSLTCEIFDRNNTRACHNTTTLLNSVSDPSARSCCNIRCPPSLRWWPPRSTTLSTPSSSARAWVNLPLPASHSPIPSWHSPPPSEPWSAWADLRS